MNNLAIGIRFEDGATWSIGVKYTDPQKIADALTMNNVVPDEILIVANTNDGPEVTEHYVLNKHYSALTN